MIEETCLAGIIAANTGGKHEDQVLRNCHMSDSLVMVILPLYEL